jgi:hypothetical protein
MLNVSAQHDFMPAYRFGAASPEGGRGNGNNSEGLTLILLSMRLLQL